MPQILFLAWGKHWLLRGCCQLPLTDKHPVYCIIVPVKFLIEQAKSIGSVSSVFGDLKMAELMFASGSSVWQQQCAEHLTFMMCHFCSPYQANWYSASTGKVSTQPRRRRRCSCSHRPGWLPLGVYLHAGCR